MSYMKREWLRQHDELGIDEPRNDMIGQSNPPAHSTECRECGAEIIENVCKCGDAEDREAIQVEAQDKAERRYDAKSGYPTCSCGQLLSAHEISTNKGDCFGCRVNIRHENIKGMCKVSGAIVYRSGQTVWYVVDGVVWSVADDKKGMMHTTWHGAYPDWSDTMRACGKSVG